MFSCNELCIRVNHPHYRSVCIQQDRTDIRGHDLSGAQRAKRKEQGAGSREQYESEAEKAISV